MLRALFALMTVAAVNSNLAANAMNAQQHVLKQITVEQPDGSKKVKYIATDLVTPGETIVYALTFHNDEAEPVSDVVLVMPVPAEIGYIDGSASRRITEPTYSVDDGATFETREDIRVLQDDGTTRPADASDITHIRWQISKAIAVGETGQLWFRGILK